MRRFLPFILLALLGCDDMPVCQAEALARKAAKKRGVELQSLDCYDCRERFCSCQAKIDGKLQVRKHSSAVVLIENKQNKEKSYRLRKLFKNG